MKWPSCPRSAGGPAVELELTQSGNYFALTRHAIDSRAIAARVLAGTDGAVITFEGVGPQQHQGPRAPGAWITSVTNQWRSR